jgi:hypothetical protein
MLGMGVWPTAAGAAPSGGCHLVGTIIFDQGISIAPMSARYHLRGTVLCAMTPAGLGPSMFSSDGDVVGDFLFVLTFQGTYSSPGVLCGSGNVGGQAARRSARP